MGYKDEGDIGSVQEIEDNQKSMNCTLFSSNAVTHTDAKALKNSNRVNSPLPCSQSLVSLERFKGCLHPFKANPSYL